MRKLDEKSGFFHIQPRGLKTGGLRYGVCYADIRTLDRGTVLLSEPGAVSGRGIAFLSEPVKLPDRRSYPVSDQRRQNRPRCIHKVR